MEFKIEGFEIGRKIGEGGFCKIFLGKKIDSGEIVAIKIEPKSAAKKTLDWDIKVLTKVEGNKLFPQYVASGDQQDFKWLAMEYLGPSLDEIIAKLPSQKLSTRCALIISKLLLDACEITHEKGFIHRDLKPGNILLRKSLKDPIALSDFGLAKVYFDEASKMHLPAKPHSGFPGTFMYASPNAHMRRDLSRRDDLFSWFYVLCDLLTNDLPWKNMTSSQEILNAKAHMDIEELGKIVEELPKIWSMITPLSYVAKPDYNGIRSLIEQAIARYPDQKDFDWHPEIFNMEDNSPIEFP